MLFKWFTKKNVSRYIFLMPLALVIIAVTIIPLLYLVGVSFTDFFLQRSQAISRVGIFNYIQLLTDARFRNSLINTLFITGTGLVLQFGLGLGITLLVNGVSKGKMIITTLLSTPIMISPAATGFIFRLLYDPSYGPINYLIGRVLGRQVTIGWLSSPSLAPWAIVLADTWQWTPFFILIFLAGLSSIPEEVLEAAKLDCTPWRVVRFISIPYLRTSMMIATILRGIDLLKVFDLVFILTMGGPSNATETVSFYSYLVGLQFFRVGYGAALSLILLLIVVLLSKLFLHVTHREGDGIV